MDPDNSDILESSITSVTPHEGSYPNVDTQQPSVFPHSSNMWLSDESQETLPGPVTDDNSATLYETQPEENITKFESFDEFFDNNMVVTTKAGHGKFSVYFVIFATVLALGIFAYSLVRLIRQCQRSKSYERDLFCRAENSDTNLDENDEEIDGGLQHNMQMTIQGVDPNGLLQGNGKLSAQMSNYV